MGLSPLVVFLSVILWAWVLGPVGMGVAALLVVGLKLALEVSDSTRWLVILLGPATQIIAGSQRAIPALAAREGWARHGGVMVRGIALGAGIVVGLSACATPGTQTAFHPPAVFEHRVSAADVRVFWNCTQPEQNLLQVDGVVQNIGGQLVQVAEVEVVAVNTSGRTVSSARSAVDNIRLQTNQRSPFLIQLRTLGDEVRFDMFYRHKVRDTSGIGAAGLRQIQNMARDVCSPTQYRPQEPG